MVLAAKAAKGDRAAFHELVDRHAQRLYRLAVSLVGGAADAEDVLQETFAGAFRNLRTFEARSSVKTWLSRILVIQAAKWRRERTRRGGEEPMPAGIAAGDQTAAAQARIDLDAALQQLSPEHREVLVLREMQQMSYEEIAQALDIPRGTVESRLHRAREQLREKLQAYLP